MGLTQRLAGLQVRVEPLESSTATASMSSYRSARLSETGADSFDPFEVGPFMHGARRGESTA